MKRLTIFRILSFILIPFAALFGLMDLVILLGSLANPGFLLLAFVLASFVIYTFVSLRFLMKGIDMNRHCARSLRDWIRVNAFVSSFMGTLFILNAFSIFFTSDAALRRLIDQFMETQPTMPAMLNQEMFVSLMKGMAWFMFFLGLVLVIHIQINFRLLKQYGYLFEEPQQDEPV